MRLAISCLATLLLSTSALAAPRVIASIMPVHSIVASVMGDVGIPELLLSGKNSEHTASLSPQQLSDLGKADAVFMIGGGLEHKLGQVSGGRSRERQKILHPVEAPGIKTLKDTRKAANSKCTNTKWKNMKARNTTIMTRRS